MGGRMTDTSRQQIDVKEKKKKPNGDICQFSNIELEKKIKQNFNK